jgi:hypothetical protein
VNKKLGFNCNDASRENLINYLGIKVDPLMKREYFFLTFKKPDSISVKKVIHLTLFCIRIVVSFKPCLILRTVKSGRVQIALVWFR